MNFKGTPGPWYMHDSRSYDKIYERYAGTFDIRTNPAGTTDSKSLWLADVKPYDGHGFTGKEVAEANAKLIAASPDMFDAIKKALEIKQLWFPGGDYGVEHEGEAQALQSMFNALEAAINKATT